MILTETEKHRLHKVTKEIAREGIRPMYVKGVSSGDVSVDIKLGNTKLRLRMERGYWPDTGHFVYGWKLYVGNVHINESEDGQWWDIIRDEIPKLEQLVADYNFAIYDKQRRDVEYKKLQRDKELQRAAEICEGKSSGDHKWYIIAFGLALVVYWCLRSL
jgi:hypothetical protein